MVEIKHVSDVGDAERLRDEGYEPVECSFGNESVVGDLLLDHHGEPSGRDPVSLQAAELALNGHRRDRFVVAGKPDCDQFYAIGALSGELFVDMGDARAVAVQDTDPIGRPLTSSPEYEPVLMFNHFSRGLGRSSAAVYGALQSVRDAFNGNYTSADVECAHKMEENRRRNIRGALQVVEPGEIGLARSSAWGFDVWYEEAPVIVQYNPRAEKITLGLCPKAGGTLSKRTGFDLLGEDGLNAVYPVLDKEIAPGWGGRDVVGGSPRGRRMSCEDAANTYLVLKESVSL